MSERGQLRLTMAGARALLLEAQGLRKPVRRVVRKRNVLDTVRRMGVLQIDTISVIARSPYLVLWSRLGAYDPCWLNELLADGALFEYWSHAACFLPAEDFGVYRRDMLTRPERWQAWMAEHSELATRILDRVRKTGPVRSSDFERAGGPGSGWWYGIARGCLKCLGSTIGSRCIRRGRGGSSGTTRFRSCIEARWWAGWTRRRTEVMGGSKCVHCILRMALCRVSI